MAVLLVGLVQLLHHVRGHDRWRTQGAEARHPTVAHNWARSAR